MKECIWCENTGKCRECKGKGCDWCGETGECTACLGTGEATPDEFVDEIVLDQKFTEAQCKALVDLSHLTSLDRLIDGDLLVKDEAIGCGPFILTRDGRVQD